MVLKVPQNIEYLKNTESNIMVTDLGVLSYFSRDDLFNNHSINTNTRLWKNNNTSRKLTIKLRKLQLYQGRII